MTQISSLILDQFPDLDYCEVLKKSSRSLELIAKSTSEVQNWLDWFHQMNLNLDLFRVKLKDQSALILKKVNDDHFLAIHNRTENLAMLLTFLRGFKYLQETHRDEEVLEIEAPKSKTEAELKMMDAQRIQQLIIPSLSALQSDFKGVFVVHQQQDLVGGDFYWYHKFGNSVILALVDCTGHSVEGAMTSMVCNSLLNQALGSFDPKNVSAFVRHFCDQIEEYNQTARDMFNYGIGAELGVFCFNYDSNEFRFSSTGISAYLKWKSNLELLKAKKIMVHSQLSKLSDVVYSMDDLEGVYGFTDGLTDQFNAMDDKKLGYRGVKDMIMKEESFNSNYYAAALNAWKGDNMQYDDITMIGIAV